MDIHFLLELNSNINFSISHFHSRTINFTFFRNFANMWHSKDALSLAKQKTDHSVCSSNTHRRHCKAPVAARSLSSQESTNRANLCLPSDSATIDEKDEIVPLSGKPYFACVMTKSQVQAPFQLTIPKSIWMLLPFACVPVVLSYRNKTWEMRYYGDRNLRRFDSGWKHFAVDNNLKIGDACFLELMDDQHLKFQVQILRGDIPREIVESGCSFDTPIMIE
ncbi:B3 domain-containing protein Os04g0386900 isoform X3 [Elaeis guineensis]|uniref:B3 domain-containing protein Os04g0386900 isoform X3 n=1 Tax=Elaeis guineensis var. tenera TaxID=51953 RepID=UPI003C6D5924